MRVPSGSPPGPAPQKSHFLPLPPSGLVTCLCEVGEVTPTLPTWGMAVKEEPVQPGHAGGASRLRLLPCCPLRVVLGTGTPAWAEGTFNSVVSSCPLSVTPDCCFPLYGLPCGDCRPGLVHRPQSVQVSCRWVGRGSQARDGDPFRM